MRGTSFFTAPIFISNASQIYHSALPVLETRFSPPCDTVGYVSKAQLSPCSCQPDHRQSPCLQLGAEERTSFAHFSRVSRQLLRFPRRLCRCWWSRTVVLMMQLAVMWCGPEGSMPLFPLISFTSWHLPVLAQSLLNNGRKMKDEWKMCVCAQTRGRFCADYCRGFCFFIFLRTKTAILHFHEAHQANWKAAGP